MNWGRFGKTIETQTSITLFYKINFHENLKNHTSTFENIKKIKFPVQILEQNQNTEKLAPGVSWETDFMGPILTAASETWIAK